MQQRQDETHTGHHVMLVEGGMQCRPAAVGNGGSTNSQGNTGLGHGVLVTYQRRSVCVGLEGRRHVTA